MSNFYRFGQFVLDPAKRTVSRADSPISLTPKAFDVLLFLVQNPKRLVTKDELLQAVWGGTFVEEGNLTQYVSHLRRALGDNSEETRLIATITRKGYQFAEDVAFSDEVGPAKHAAARVHVTERLQTDASLPFRVPTIQIVASTTKPRRKGVAVAPAIFLWALAAGVLLAVGALSIWRYEVYRHRITLAPTDTIVLADVDNRTSDPIFDGALNTALRYEIEQTPYLNLLGLDKTYATVGQMKLAPTTKITPELARQICSSTNSKMAIADSIADAGNGYHLDIRALDCGSGATLAEETTDITARNQVIHELGVTVARLRRKLGEPAESLARFNQPLDIATSASLEALQTGAEGTKLFLAGDPAAALPLYQRGIELDPDLALTYEGIGAVNQALRHYDLMAASWTRAYQLRDRMTEKDRLNAEYLYYNSVTGELDKAYSVLVRARELFPRDVFIHNNLAFALRGLGQPKRSADLEDETAQLNPNPLYFSSAVFANISASRFEEAASWLAQAETLKFDSLQLRDQRLQLAIIEGDRGAVDRTFEGEGHGPNQVVFLSDRSIFEGQEGHFDAADRLSLQASKRSSDLEDVSRALVSSALRNAEAGRVIQARKMEEQA